MSFERQDDIGSARRKVKEAEDALESYLHGAVFAEERFAELAGAVKAARREFLSRVSALSPEKRGPASGSSGKTNPTRSAEHCFDDP